MAVAACKTIFNEGGGALGEDVMSASARHGSHRKNFTAGGVRHCDA